MTKKTIIKYVVIAIILIGALVGIKFLIAHLTKPDTPDYYGQYVGNDGYSINIDKDGLHLTLDGETETYQDYTIDGNTISFADQKVYFYENNKVLSAGINGSELFNMSCDTPTRNSNFAGEWISYDSSFGVTLTYIFNSNGTFTRYQALVNNYEAGTYTLKDGVLILNYINAFTNANYYTEVCYVDETHTLHTTVFVKNLSDFIPAVQTPTPDFSQPSDNDTPSTDDTPSTISYTITYHYNDGSDSISTQNVNADDHFTLITPTRKGYAFSEWYDYDNYQTVNNGIYNYNKDITLTAHWEIINYNINYNLDGGTLPEGAESTFNIDSLPRSLPTPTKENCSFIGWYENSDFSGEPILTLSKDILKNYTLYAKFTDNPAEYLNFMEVDGYQVVTGYIGKPYYITIPETHDGLPVTTINENAFYDCDSLTSVTIPDSVTSIGDHAFSDCYSLTSVTIPDSVTSIGSSAFFNCNSLTSVTIGNSVMSIESNTFYDCDSLTSVTIGNSVTSIGSFAFRDCTSLTNITIPNSVTSIGYGAFESCNKLTSVTIPDGLDLDYDDFNNTNIPTTIKDNVRYMQFNNNPYYYAYDMVVNSATTLTIDKDCKAISISNSSITRVNISDFSSWCEISFAGYSKNPLYYGADLYLNGTLIEGDITIPSTVNIIRDYVFFNYDCITSITIPNSVTSIGSDAFYSCDSLTSVTIPNSVTSIGSDAFYNCYSLKSVTIGNSVTSIGMGAFSNCSSLTSVNHLGTIEQWCGITFDSYDANPLCYAKNLYLNGELVTDLVIPNTVTKINNYAFYRCSSLTNVVIPDLVTSIGSSAFYECTSLTSVTIGNSVTSIGDQAFYGCDRLTSVTIGNSVTSIGSYAFYGCSGLTSVYYMGNTEQWSEITIGSDNYYLASAATRYYYSETEPTDDGNYWHYVDGVVTIWE